MKPILNLIGLLGLALTGLPAFFVFAGSLELDTCKWLMLLGTVLWFARAIFFNSQAKEPSS